MQENHRNLCSIQWLVNYKLTIKLKINNTNCNLKKVLP